MAILNALFERRSRHVRAGLRELGPGLLALYDNAPVGIGFMSEEGRFLTGNAALQEMLGYSELELRKMEFNALTHPADRSACQALFDSARRGSLGRFEIEKRFIAKDGRLVWAYVAVTVVPNGRGKQLVGLAVDITERKKAQARLEESERKYRTLYNRTPAMMHSIDVNRRVIAVSDLWLETLGYKRHEVIGRESVDFLTPEARRFALERGLPAYFVRGDCRDVPYQYVKKDGEVMDVLLSATSQRDAAGNFERSLAVIQDVTQRNRDQRKIEKLNAELEQRARETATDLQRSGEDLEAFAGAAANDLAAPLRKIRDGADLLEKLTRVKLNRRELGLLRRVRAAAAGLAGLVEDVLRLARMNRRTGPPALVALDEVVAEVLADLEVPFAQAGAQVRAAALPEILGYRPLLRLLFQNLIANALKAPRSGVPPVITIAASQAPDGGVEVSVADNGAGFDPRLGDEVFEPFRSVHVEGEDGAVEEEGAIGGIGLALCQRVAARHGGRVTAASVPGEGSVFTLWLPPSATP